MKGLFRGALALLLAMSAVTVNADNQYPNGIEGIKAGSLPPTGFYYRMYNLYYSSDTLKNGGGEKLDVDFDATLYANAHRFLWVSDIDVLGGSFAADVIIPLEYKDLKIGALNLSDNDFNLADVIVEPVAIGWHGDNWDATVASGVFAPIGHYDSDDIASVGSNMWTFLETFGGTLYLDSDKEWSISALARYEIHTQKEDVNLTPGNDLHFEYGIGRTFCQIIDVGVSGYANWQITSDTGRGRAASDAKDRVIAVGPEASWVIPKIGAIVKGAVYWETLAQDRPEGVIGNITLTKMF